MGHEFGGIIESTGDDVSSDLIGKQVAVLPLLSCGSCEYCQNNQENLCDLFAYYGLLGDDGGFAEYAVVNKDNVIPVENSAVLTFIEPLLVAIHAASKIKKHLEKSRILILGAGAIGISVASILRDIHDADVTFNDILPNRLKRVASAGFDVIEPADLHSEKYDIVIDCAGSDLMSKETAFLQSFDHLKKGGVFVGIAAYFHPLSFVPIRWVISETMMIHSFAYTHQDAMQLPDVLKKLKVDFSAFCEEIALDDVINEGFYRSEIDKDSFTRLVVKC